ncbi:glycosyltransferase [Pseudovibrio sp. Tun.PSC04-5.I4]|uniref:glycosyltransferase family 2 protein n=1 Tax=Pseudovibrio sp. Tun.PSC04-5.I4 TaxID=1798213 RepID=UPI00089078B8|nr:glycosyltransferase [Pseudovibrio sp. Tun.PSC04-5.I4]SDQ80923.1 Glycosyl transferase family 2 [Pseudovibrio sp. Tun.PSC04-5.I4]
MISALIPTKDSERLLVHTLSSLVSASAEGILKEVVVADGGSTDNSAIVADASGADWIESGNDAGSALCAGVEACKRGDWVLVIKPGAILQTDWQNEAVGFIERASRTRQQGTIVGVYSYRSEEFGVLARVKQTLIGLKHAMWKTTCYDLPFLVQKKYLQSCLARAPMLSVNAQLQKILRASRVHWLNSTVVFQRNES